jgi:ribosomal protein S18 acetylase RimI-like enzyme
MRIVSNGVQIRRLAETDYQAVFRIHRQVNGKTVLTDETDFARIFKGFLTDADREAYVAVLYNRVIGFVTLYYLDVWHYYGRIASIQELLVTEEFRGRGVGRALLEFVRQRVKEQQCRGLEVATDLWQSRARNFYQRCGLHGKTRTMVI